MGKKNLLLIASLLIFSVVSAFAQAGSYRRPSGSRPSGNRTSQRHTSYSWLHSDDDYVGVRVGYNDALLSFRGCEGVEHTSMSGLNFGLVYGISLSYDSPVFFETGLLYTGKGAHLRKGHDEHYSVRMNFMEVPFVIKYKIETDIPELSIMPFGGGFTAVGFGGKYKDFMTRQKYTTFQKGFFRRYDLGFRLGCGIQYQSLYAEMSYDIGMVNMASSKPRDLEHYLNYDSFNDKIRTGALSLTVGVNF